VTLARGKVRGAEALLDELAADARLAVKWLDKRADKSAPVTVTALRRHLHREPLPRLRQARVALLSFMVHGYVVASGAKFFDTRAVWSPERVDDLASATRTAAEGLADELYDRCWCRDEVLRHIGFRLEQETLAERQEAWGVHAVTDTPAQRQQTRRSLSADRQLDLLNHLDDAAARDGAGDWRGAPSVTWGAAMVRDVTEVTGYKLSQSQASSLLRTAMKRLRYAARVGVKPAEVRRAYRAELQGLMVHVRSYAANNGGSGFPRYVQVIEPLTSPRDFKRLLGWVRSSSPEVGAFKAVERTHPARSQSAGTALQSDQSGAGKIPSGTRKRRAS
jgi:hypothetical protein